MARPTAFLKKVPLPKKQRGGKKRGTPVSDEEFEDLRNRLRLAIHPLLLGGLSAALVLQ